MTHNQRTRQCDLDVKPIEGPPSRNVKQICIPCDEKRYREICQDKNKFRQFLDPMIARHPELFPAAISQGYQLDGCHRESKKIPGVRLRRIKLKHNGEVYTIRPSCLLPYLVGLTDEVEKPMLLLSYGAPPHLITYCFGKNDMYWHRLVARLGHFNLVGTTVRNDEALPRNLAADEYHTTVQGEKVYLPFTVGDGVVLGLSAVDTADGEQLTAAYGEFKTEAQNVQPNYAPQTVNTDGWKATRLAWRTVFPQVALVLCFLHGFLKVYDVCRKRFPELRNRIWEAFREPTKEGFLAALEALANWSKSEGHPSTVQANVQKLRQRGEDYAVSYDHPTCRRTSNMADRLMNLLDRTVSWGRRLHGDLSSARFRLRGWALLLNFRPFSVRHQLRHRGQPVEWRSAAHRLNGEPYVYHENWLHQLYVSGSMAGWRRQIQAIR